LVTLLTEACQEARFLARGLSPVGPNPSLAAALRKLARSVEEPRTGCRFIGEADLRLDDNSTATHLYRIAREAAHNAVNTATLTRLSFNSVARTGGSNWKSRTMDVECRPGSPGAKEWESTA
jgi:signal transduction histidine kinase